jgi:hypothetical protein
MLGCRPLGWGRLKKHRVSFGKREYSGTGIKGFGNNKTNLKGKSWINFMFEGRFTQPSSIAKIE